MISLEEAKEILLKQVKAKDTEQISVFKAKDRILAEDVYSPIDNPPFPKSPLDGYAVRAEDLQGASKEQGIKLKVIDKIYAGYVSKEVVKKGTAIRIMTGAPIPEGADCIVRQEDTLAHGEVVEIFVSHKPYENYCYRGEDFKAGCKVIEKNIKLTSTEITAMASLGFDKVSVYKKPIIGIITTGDEIQNQGAKLQPGKIYNSNRLFLYTRILELGGEPILYDLVNDDDANIEQIIRIAEQECDLIVSTGGVSVGEKDRVKESTKLAGYDILFWKVNMKPGSPMFGAVKNNKIYVGLSGTPVAAATTFELTVRPLIAKMLQCEDIDIKNINAVLQDDFSKLSSKRRFLRVRLEQYTANQVYINEVYQSPGQIHTMLNSNAIMEVPAGKVLNKGDVVEILI